MTYTEKELNQFLHGISLSLLSKKSAQHWRYDEETAKEIEWLEALERKVRADKADRKTENSSEIPNNCEECKHWNDTEDGCADRHGCRTTTEDWQDWKDKMWAEAIVTEPTTEDCSTVPTCSVNGRPYDCGKCEYFRCTADEPQTETEIAREIVHKMIDNAIIAEDAYPNLRQRLHDAVDEYEPQTERSSE